MTESIETVQKVVNSSTNRLIKIGSPLYKKLVRRGYILTKGEQHDILAPRSNSVYEQSVAVKENMGHHKLEMFKKSQRHNDDDDESVKEEVKHNGRDKFIADLQAAEEREGVIKNNDNNSSSDESMSEIEERLTEMLKRRDTVDGKRRVGRPSKLKLSTRLFLEDLKNSEKYSK